MNKISESQKRKNAAISKIKAKLIEETGNVCRICGKYGNDTMHLLPKSIYPEYYLEPRNLIIGCRECHRLFDDVIEFRRAQESLISQCSEFALESDVTRYFKI
jgi:hypothetical protein